MCPLNLNQTVRANVCGLASIYGRPYDNSLTPLGNTYPTTLKNGLAGLRRGISTGKTPKLTAAQRATLKKIVAYKVLANVGFPAHANCTLNLVTQQIEKKWEVSYPLKDTANRFHNPGFSYTQPTYILKKADPAKEKVFKNKTYPDLKKPDEWRDLLLVIWGRADDPGLSGDWRHVVPG